MRRKVKEARIERNSAEEYARFFRGLDGPSRAGVETQTGSVLESRQSATAAELRPALHKIRLLPLVSDRTFREDVSSTFLAIPQRHPSPTNGRF